MRSVAQNIISYFLSCFHWMMATKFGSSIRFDGNARAELMDSRQWGFKCVWLFRRPTQAAWIACICHIVRARPFLLHIERDANCVCVGCVCEPHCRQRPRRFMQFIFHGVPFFTIYLLPFAAEQRNHIQSHFHACVRSFSNSELISTQFVVALE